MLFRNASTAQILRRQTESTAVFRHRPALRAQFRYVPAKAGLQGQYPQILFQGIAGYIESSETRRCRFGSDLSFRQRRLRDCQVGRSDRETLPPASRLAKTQRYARTESPKRIRPATLSFSYYCYGMSFVDMAYLTTDHIQRLADGNYIVYKRNKIKHQKNATAIRIHITPEIQGLIEQLKSASPTVENYLLPIITCSGYTGEKLYNHIRSRYAKYQKYLKSLAEELGIDYH